MGGQGSGRYQKGDEGAADHGSLLGNYRKLDREEQKISEKKEELKEQMKSKK